MSEVKAPAPAKDAVAKAKAYKIKKGKGGISLPGFPFDVTEEMLNDKVRGWKVVGMIERYEKERGVQVFGSVIVME